MSKWTRLITADQTYHEDYTITVEDDLPLIKYNNKDYILFQVLVNVEKIYNTYNKDIHDIVNGEDKVTYTIDQDILDEFVIDEIYNVELIDPETDEIIKIENDKNLFNEILNNKVYMNYFYNYLKGYIE